MSTPSHSCFKPSKPYQFTSRSDLEDFRGEVDEYKRCIQDFVEEQEDAVRKHREAVDDAIEDWNSFVNFELD